MGWEVDKGHLAGVKREESRTKKEDARGLQNTGQQV
jgi:hypothetical protein